MKSCYQNGIQLVFQTIQNAKDEYVSYIPQVYKFIIKKDSESFFQYVFNVETITWVSMENEKTRERLNRVVKALMDLEVE